MLKVVKQERLVIEQRSSFVVVRDANTIDNACARGKLKACKVSVQKNAGVSSCQILWEAVGEKLWQWS